jgi:hypothetical protein
LEYWDSLINKATKGGVTFYAVDVGGLNPYYDPIAMSSALVNYAASLSQQQGPASIQPQGAQIRNSPGARPSAGQVAQWNQAPSGPSPTALMMEMAHQDDYIKFAVSSANPQEALRELAERTGGFIIANTNNTDKLLAHVMEEVDTHYEIAYPPSIGARRRAFPENRSEAGAARTCAWKPAAATSPCPTPPRAP